MYRRTVTYTWSKAIIDAMLAAAGAAPDDPLFTTPKAILFTNDLAVTPESLPASFTVPTFTGYAAAALTFSVPVSPGSADRALVATVRFLCTATPGEAAVIRGYLVTDGATAFYGGEVFTETLNIAEAGQYLDLDLILPLPLLRTPSVN